MSRQTHNSAYYTNLRQLSRDTDAGVSVHGPARLATDWRQAKRAGVMLATESGRCQSAAAREGRRAAQAASCSESAPAPSLPRRAVYKVGRTISGKTVLLGALQHPHKRGAGATPAHSA